MLAKQLTISSFVITFLGVSFRWTWSQFAAVGKFLDAKSVGHSTANQNLDRETFQTGGTVQSHEEITKRVDVSPNRTNIMSHVRRWKKYISMLKVLVLAAMTFYVSKRYSSRKPTHQDILKKSDMQLDANLSTTKWSNLCIDWKTIVTKTNSTKGSKIPDNHVYIYIYIQVII